MQGQPTAVFFGTYDVGTHPRVGVLQEGLAANGFDVVEINEPLDFPTHARVELLTRPWKAPALAWRVARAWWTLWRRGRNVTADIVVVGYLGHFDVHLARRRFGAPIVLDYLVGLGDTSVDRGVAASSRIARVLSAIDRRAVAAADVVLVDTNEQAAMCPADDPIVVPVGAPSSWFRDPARHDDVLRVVFSGLYTPLQGTHAIGEAIGALGQRRDISFTMIGDGQDRAECERLAGPRSSGQVEWIDWIEASELAAVVNEHHVCLGIFGTTPKAARVVPNKVFQGVAAGCAIVTADTPPQRRVLDDAAAFVAPGDGHGLAATLAELADDPARLAEHREAAARLADSLRPLSVCQPLVRALGFAAA